MISLNLEKAFDTIYTHTLTYRLHMVELPTRLIQIVQNYTSNKSIHVHTNHYTSTLRPTLLRLLQGLALGPVLFSLHINSICKFNDHTIVNADMLTAIVTTSHNANILENVLQHVNLLDEHVVKYNLKVNIDKYQTTLFTLKKNIIFLKPIFTNNKLS